MSKLIAVITAGVFAAGTMFAADPNQCAEQIAECKASLAKLEVPGAKKNIFNQQLDAFGKNGCPPFGQLNIKRLAQMTFNPEQYETFKAECKLMP
jgi:hypothetical protein